MARPTKRPAPGSRKALAASQAKALAPAGESTVVFRDSAFADDMAKTKFTAILQQHGLENVHSL
jgi:hypothetical protein